MGNVNMEAYQVHYRGDESVADHLRQLDLDVEKAAVLPDLPTAEGKTVLTAITDDQGGTELTYETPEVESEDIAPAFSEETEYSEGDLVYYDGILYKFAADHTAGAWEPSEVTQTTVAAEFNQLKNTLTHKPLREFRRGNNIYKGDSLSLTSDIMDYDGYIMIIGVFPNAGQESVILPKSVIRLLSTTRHITIGNYYGDNSDYFARIDVELTSSSIKYKTENIGRSVGTCFLQIIDYTDALS